MSEKKIKKTVGRKAIWHGGQLHKSGDEIELTAAEIEKLDLTPATPVKEVEVEIIKNVPLELSDDQRIRLCVGYWLDVPDGERTQAGLPKVDTMKKLTGFENISADDVRAAGDIIDRFAVEFVPKTPENGGDDKQKQKAND